ncbi:pyridoxamine 5'-phosphate oxidase family protein [Streptacidiphilus sp. PB12-B1b]|uniref:pyridoxamine 5'-phosphate oxidase family protein n=1 Tax=Streptacidiphilus sp. PB12-B1b TaxID=2705012 RepID=UPI0015FE4532|nr:pyridoxamine 5'-phosphate oxidase family protein [Streptacidiphilus sp. PB12-B1b]QMU78042.1 pyridoxamine 5'-phosphate oxidase family protein [Streptacidiphilus sp. PB12-B1b]
MTTDGGYLDEVQCLRLMAGMAVGRVVYTRHALPAVLPVRFRLDSDGSVLVSVDARSELVGAVTGAVVAFETGQVDASDGSGWSVTVLGLADVTPAPATTLAASPAGRSAVASAAGEVQLRIRPQLVSGRRLEGRPSAAPGRAPDAAR